MDHNFKGPWFLVKKAALPTRVSSFYNSTETSFNHTRALSRLKADLILTWRKSGVWTTNSKHCVIAKFKSTKSALVGKKAAYGRLQFEMRGKLTCDVKRNPQAIRLCSQKRQQRRTLPEEELFSSFFAYFKAV